MSVRLLTVVDVWLTADRTDHVANVSFSDDYFKMMLQAIAANTALAARWVQHLTTSHNKQIGVII